MKNTIPIALALLLTGCPKGDNAGGGTSTPSSGSAPVATPVPIASSVPTVVENPIASPTAKTTASAPVASAKPKDGGTVAARIARSRIEGNNFALDVSAPACSVNDECAMTVKLLPGGEFHLNKEYPYKFLAASAPNVTFLGKGEATTFSKASGDFKEEGEKSATMVVRYKPTAAGNAAIGGTYKFSVCSADQCQIEQQKVTLNVPVM